MCDHRETPPAKDDECADCKLCDCEGTIDGEVCPGCHGNGYVRAQLELDVT